MKTLETVKSIDRAKHCLRIKPLAIKQKVSRKLMASKEHRGKRTIAIIFDSTELFVDVVRLRLWAQV